MIREYYQNIKLLRSFVEEKEFKGYDPYDTLNSVLPFTKLPKNVQAILIQLQKRNPVNIRQVLGIKEEYNPKGLALLLEAYSYLYSLTPDENTKRIICFLFDKILELRSKNTPSYCWGYNFNWTNPQKVVPKFHPTIVATAFVGKAVFQYYNLFKDNKAAEVLKGISTYILDDLPRTESKDGICFSYSDLIKDCCFNASMLGAEILIKTYSITKEEHLLKFAEEAVDFTVKYQKEDGKWNYAVDIITGREDPQVDFHQGYVLDSLLAFIKYSKNDDIRYRNAYKKGLEFYKNKLFFEDGRSIWRFPKVYPVDIHNQTQGIITFANAHMESEEYLNFANTICNWTLDNFQDRRGFIYYRKYRLFFNKIPFMRWSQAWMLLALSKLLYTNKNNYH